MPFEHVMLREPTTGPAHPTPSIFQKPSAKFSTDFGAPFAPKSGFNFGSIALHSPTERDNSARHPALAFQRKLEIGSVDDPLERDADETAEHVLRMPESARRVPTDSSLHMQRKCASCVREDKEQDGQFARKAMAPSGDVPSSSVPPIVHHVLRQPGHQLDRSTRDFLEPRFGRDLANIRVHTDSAAGDSARAVNARAWTVGKDIAFAPGQYAPETHAGRLLLAHELTHSIQQGASPPQQQHGQGARFGRAQMMLQRQVADPRKLQIETTVELKHIRKSEWLLEEVPGGGSSITELYWVDFEVDDAGVMSASVRTVSPDRAYRSGTLKFGDEFRKALKLFDESGVEVKAFEGDWSYMTKDEISENLKAFREGMAEGLTREQAAAKTPTGKVVKRSGFEVTSVENVPESQPHLVEEGVRRWHVKAIFGRKAVPGPGSSPQGSLGGKSATPTAGVPKTSTVGGGIADVKPAAVSEPKVLDVHPGSAIPEGKLRGGSLGVEPSTGPSLGEFAVAAVKSIAVDTIVAAVVLEALHLAHAWLAYEKNVESEGERQFRELFEKNVTPGVEKALKVHAREAAQMTAQNPEFPVYANVTVELDESWTVSGIAGSESEKAVTNARFVDLGLSFKKVSKEETINTHSSSGFFSDVTTHYATRRVTYPVEVSFAETPAQHQWRMFLHQAAQAAARHLSARAVAGHTHFGGGALSAAEEREERRRAKWGEPSLLEEHEREERKVWVRAYIEYTALHGPDDLYADALKYLAELDKPAALNGVFSPFGRR